MNKDNNLTPRLRFPEFKNQGKWEEKPIEKLGNTIAGLKSKKGSDFGKGKPYVTYKQVFDKSYIDFKECGKVEIKDNENQNKIKKGDILFTTSSETPDEVGFASVVLENPKEEIFLNSFCFALRPNDLNALIPQFSRYLFHSPIYRKKVSSIAQGSTRFNLSKNVFLNISLLLPQPTEQQKIASCLSSLDELLEAHKKKRELLKVHKKGLMQNLFPKGGDKVPKLRFPEFKYSGEWEEKMLGELATKVLKKNKNGIIKIVFTNSAIDGIIEQRNFFNKDIANKSNLENYYIVEQGDYVYNPRISKYAPVGPLFKNRTNKTGVMSPLYTIFRFNNKDNDFYQYYFKSNHWFFSIKKISNKGARFDRISITSSVFMEIPILSPPIQEQQKIADCLSSIDELITAEVEKIEQLEKHKKGLMQGLFPEIN